MRRLRNFALQDAQCMRERCRWHPSMTTLRVLPRRLGLSVLCAAPMFGPPLRRVVVVGGGLAYIVRGLFWGDLQTVR